jgi:hypothetical protein
MNPPNFRFLPNLECDGLFTLLAPIFEGSFEGPPLLLLHAPPTNSDLKAR